MSRISTERVLETAFVIASMVGAGLFLAPSRPNLEPWIATLLAAAGGCVWAVLMILAARSAQRHFGRTDEARGRGS